MKEEVAWVVSHANEDIFMIIYAHHNGSYMYIITKRCESHASPGTRRPACAADLTLCVCV